MDELTFANPEMIWLAGLVLGLSVWALLQLRGLQRRLARLGTGPVVQRLVASFSPTANTWRIVCVGLAMLMLVAALTRPRYGLRETEVANAGIDIVFAVDASKSMLVRDVVPSRLLGTGLEISALLKRLAGGRVALLPFAGIPFVQCPLTTDHDVVRTYMSELRPGDMPVGGTNIGRAITTAMDLLAGDKERAEATMRGNLVPEFKGSKHKAIVLFSDGEDHEGAALEAAAKAKAQGVRIYTVGVGSGFGDPVPETATDGSITGTVKDQAGNPIFSKLNDKLLKDIAARSGGTYFHYANASVVPQLFAALDALEKAEYAETFKLLGEDRYQYLLGPALLLLLSGLLIPRRRKASAAEPVARTQTAQNKKAQTRAAAGGAAVAMLLVAGALLLPLPAHAADPPPEPAPAAAPRTAEPSDSLALGEVAKADRTGSRSTAGAARSRDRSQAEARRDPHWLERENPDISQGRELIAEGKPGPALQAFEAAQRSRPEHAVIWYDLGLAHALAGDHKTAASAFGRSLSAMDEADPELEADLHFAAGTSQLQWGQQIERDSKIEAQGNGGANPAGGQPGDPGAQGAQPEPPPGQPAAPAPAKEDPAEHYRIAVDRLQQALLADSGRADIKRNLEIARMFAYPPCRMRDKAQEPNDQLAEAKPIALDPAKEKETRLQLRACPDDRDLFRIDLQPGDRLTASIKTLPDADPIVDPLVRDAGEPLLGLALLSADGKQHVRGAPPPAPPIDTVELNRVTAKEAMVLEVRNAAEVETPYELTVKLMPACRRLEDGLEPNDSIAGAKAITPGQPLQMRLCPLNEDWLAVPLLDGQGLMVMAKAKFDVGAEVFELDILSPSGRVMTHAVKGKEEWLARMPMAQETGSHLIRVRGGIDTEADYQLAVQVMPPCVERDDPFEHNDQALQANPMGPAMLGGTMSGLQLCPGDDDWYRVEIGAGESLVVDLSAKLDKTPDVAPLAGALTVTVYDEQGTVWGLARGGPVAQGAEALQRMAAVLMPPPGVYRVRVSGGGVAAPAWPLPPLPDGAEEVEVEVPLGDPQGGQAGVPPGAMPPGPAQPSPPSHGGLPGGAQPGIRAVPMQPGAQGGSPGQPGAPGQAGAAGQAPPPKSLKIRKIKLPEDYPRPAVDRRLARLDVAYDLHLRIVPPCPDGNDELEPNDNPGEAKPLKVGGERLLRLCKGDKDWLEVDQKAGQDLQIMARYDFAHGAINLEAFDEGGATSLARGKVAAPRLPGPLPAAGDDSPSARRGRTATTVLGLPSEKVDRKVKLLISASGEVANFYVVRVQEPPPPSDKPQQDKKDDKKDDKQQDKKKDDKKQNKKKEEEKKEDKKEEDKKTRQQRLREQMKRHDRNPANLEAQEALRNSPFRNLRPSKDW